MPSGKFHCCLDIKLNADVTSRTRKLHCYAVKFRFTSLYDKMAAACVVLNDNMSRLQSHIANYPNYITSGQVCGGGGDGGSVFAEVPI